MAVDEALWLSEVEAEIYGDSAAPATLQVRNDNKPAISIIHSGMYQESNEHIGVKFRWLREIWAAEEIHISYVEIKRTRMTNRH
jgi:hypothetical protein